MVVIPMITQTLLESSKCQLVGYLYLSLVAICSFGRTSRGRGTTGEPFRSINIVWDERISIFCQRFMYLSPLVRHSVFQDVSTRWKWIFDEESMRTSWNIFHENNVASCYTLKDLFCSEWGNGLTFPARSVLRACNLYLPFAVRRYFKQLCQMSYLNKYVTSFLKYTFITGESYILCYPSVINFHSVFHIRYNKWKLIFWISYLQLMSWRHICAYRVSRNSFDRSVDLTF